MSENPGGTKPQTDDKATLRPAGEGTASEPAAPTEIGGPTGPEPTRFGDWEKKGRCTDF